MSRTGEKTVAAPTEAIMPPCGRLEAAIAGVGMEDSWSGMDLMPREWPEETVCEALYPELDDWSPEAAGGGLVATPWRINGEPVTFPSQEGAQEITAAMVEEWREYWSAMLPTFSIERELRGLRNYLLANPEKRPLPGCKNMESYLNNTLRKTLGERLGHARDSPGKQAKSGRQSRENALDRQAREMVAEGVRAVSRRRLEAVREKLAGREKQAKPAKQQAAVGPRDLDNFINQLAEAKNANTQTA